jgi:penicillin-binding protein A
MRPLLRLFVAAAIPVALALGPGPAEAAPTRPVDLRALRVTDDAAFASIAGAKVKLTLEPRLQRAAERLLARSGAHEGAIVASDVRTGRVLAWASRGPRDYVAAAFAPSASLFKIVSAAALLSGGRVSPATRECYDGGEHAIEPRDLEQRGSICTTLGEALGRSVNLVIARLARRHLAPSALRRFARELGFDGEVPIDVPVGVSEVQIPDDPFGMARASAGFWNGRLTPLGALFAMQTIANGGERIRLSVLDRGGPVARVSVGRALDAGVARSMAQMLEVTTRRGTAARAFTHADGSRALPGIAVAAKTGTLIGGHPTRMFSWFAAFGPGARPEVAVAVMLGNDLQWHTKANVVGREFLEAYFGVKEAAAGGGQPAGSVAARATPGGQRGGVR